MTLSSSIYNQTQLRNRSYEVCNPGSLSLQNRKLFPLDIDLVFGLDLVFDLGLDDMLREVTPMAHVGSEFSTVHVYGLNTVFYDLNFFVFYKYPKLNVHNEERF